MDSKLINQILKGYIEAALWTEEERLKEEIPSDELIYGDDDNDSDELEKLIRLTANLNKKTFDEFTREDIEDDSLIKAYTDIKEFISIVGEENILLAIDEDEVEPDRIGMDLWLSRNGHGAGFFDGHYDYDREKIFIDGAKKLGTVDLYINDNMMVSFSNEHVFENSINIIITETQLKNIIITEQSRQDYLRWKRKNVTLRGMKERYSENNGGARFGSGLYTAFLSNRQMAREYGKVYFVLNAIPKNPKIVQDTNIAEIFLQRLINKWCEERNLPYDPNEFFKHTDIRTEMLNIGYDGLVVKGREMVNYNPPDNVKYFETERQLQMYYDDFIVNNK